MRLAVTVGALIASFMLLTDCGLFGATVCKGARTAYYTTEGTLARYLP